MDDHALGALAIRLAAAAAAVHRDGRTRALRVETKSSHTDLVSEVDREAERVIVEGIRAVRPDDAILGEEGGAHEGTSGVRWIIDPLDGTTNYTHGLPFFCVTIGVEHRGEIVAGAVFDPVAGEMFTATKGGGAFLNGLPIRVSSSAALIESLLVTGFPYNVKENPGRVTERFVAFLPLAQGVRRLGSAALDLAYVACGRLDGYWEVFLHPWDKAAGVLLVKEAGGTVTNFTGDERDIIHDPNTLATNGRIHGAMLDVIKRT